MRGAIGAVIFGLLTLGCATSTTSNAESANTANKIGFTLKRGGNFTSLFQYGDFSQSKLAELKVMRDLGLDFLRLPIEPSRFYDANSTDWKNLELTLNEAIKLGLRTIVDLHPLFSTQELALTGDNRYPQLLTSMAKFLNKFDRTKVLLELMNEPIAPGEEKCPTDFDWNMWQKKFYTAARAGSANITLILTGACWGGIDGLLKTTPITDPKVIYSIHNYDPFIFTHQGASWAGPQVWYMRGVPYPATQANISEATKRILYDIPTARIRGNYTDYLQGYLNEAWTKSKLVAELNRAKTWASRNNTQLLLGEFGVHNIYAPPQDKIKWLRDMREAAESLGIAHAVWDFSSGGDFGPYRDGKLEAGALAALGLKVSANAIPTPANPTYNNNYPANPVAGFIQSIADFENGSKNFANQDTQYLGYGKPQEPTYTTSGPNGTAPLNAGAIEFDYSIASENEYGGVMAIVPSGGLITSDFTHVRFEASSSSEATLRVGLASNLVDSASDWPVAQVPTTPTMTTFTIPFTVFKQGGWGKEVQLKEVLQKLDRIEITATTQGASRKIKIDNLSFVKIVDAENPAPLAQNKSTLLYDFENTNNLGNNGGSWYVGAYEQNANSKAIATAANISLNNNSAVRMNFKLPLPNQWAGAILGMPFGQVRDLRQQAALRIDLAATGTNLVRVEFASTLDTANDNPHYIVAVSPNIKTYRIPISEFAQAGWGKAVDLQSALRNSTAVSVYAETIGTEGTVTIDNVLLEQP